VIGAESSLGQNVMVADDVIVGDRVKVQCNVAIYSGVTIADDVFLGPSCVFTNVSNPRSQVVRRGLYERTFVGRGVTIGANATIVCGIELAPYTFVAAGAVVTRGTRPYELVLGVPGRARGWMSRHGHPLKFDAAGNAVCRESGLRYWRDPADATSPVRCLDLPEDAPLPAHLAQGNVAYRDLESRAAVGKRSAGEIVE